MGDGAARDAGRPTILVTRPAEDAAPLLAALEAKGYAALLVPMLRIVQREGQRLELGDATGALFTSANGVRALVRAASPAELARARALPAYAVGDATARAAREAGFGLVESAGGDVTTLADLVAARRRPEDGPLLHVAGTDVAGDLSALLAKKGFAARRIALYQALAADALEPEALALLRSGRAGGAAFFSPRTARAFVTLATTSGGADLCRNVTAYCLSAAVASALTEDMAWGTTLVASSPDQESLLALLPERRLV